MDLFQIFIENLAELGYLGALLAGFLGSSTLFFSIFPSFVVIPIIGSQLNPILVGVMAGIGAGVGQFLHYYVGVGGRKLIGRKSISIGRFKMPQLYSKRIAAIDWEKRIKKYGVVVIFVFAATPLTPDDILWIPLGIMGYPKLRALIAAILGKITLNLLYAFTGFFGMELLM